QHLTFRSRLLKKRFGRITVYLLDRHVPRLPFAPDTMRAVLHEIEIIRTPAANDHPVTRSYSFLVLFRFVVPPPEHHGLLRRQARIHNLVPTKQVVSQPGYRISHSSNKVMLYSPEIFQSMGSRQCLYRGVYPPMGVAEMHLIATNMNLPRGEQYIDFPENIGQVTVSLFKPRVKGEIRKAFRSSSAVSRICPVGRRSVAGHVYLRNDLDMPFRCITDNLPDFVLRVILSWR